MRKILFIDDDETLTAALGDFLELALEVECIRYSGLRQLAEQARSGTWPKDAVLAILDINLGPGQPNGIDVYRWLQEQSFAGRAVFLTGHAKDHPLVAEASRVGGIEVFEKPLNIDQLIALIEDGGNGQQKLRTG